MKDIYFSYNEIEWEIFPANHVFPWVKLQIPRQHFANYKIYGINWASLMKL